MHFKIHDNLRSAEQSSCLLGVSLVTDCVCIMKSLATTVLIKPLKMGVLSVWLQKAEVMEVIVIDMVHR